MRIVIQLIVTLLAASAFSAFAQDEMENSTQISVSAQGRIIQTSSPWFKVSPRGLYEMEITAPSTRFPSLQSDLRVASRDGETWTLRGIQGTGYFISDIGRIAVIGTTCCDASYVPSRLTVYDLNGRTLDAREVDVMIDPKLSSDGTRLIYRSKTGIFDLDLNSLKETSYPCFDLFAAGPDNKMAGVHLNETNLGKPSRDEANRLVIYEDNIQTHSIPIPGKIRKIEFSQDGTRLYLLTPTTLVMLPFPSGAPRQLYTSPKGGELRDIHVSPRTVYLGMRSFQKNPVSGNRVSGTLVTLDQASGPSQHFDGPTQKIEAAPDLPELYDQIPWPFKPNSQHPVGCTHGQFLAWEGYPAYLHPGIDVLGPPGQAIYSVSNGVVKALHTTSGHLNWRMAIGDEDTSGTCKGYLYVHLVESTISVNLGDTVKKGQYLGDMVGLAHYGFTHLHLARIQDTGTQWFGDWLITENCHMDLVRQNEDEAPVFENALGNDLFAFCTNQTSDYLDPQALEGEVDIIAHVHDTIESQMPCTVHEIYFTIYPSGDPQSPVIENKLAVRFDMHLDVYQGGPFFVFLTQLLYKTDTVCKTQYNSLKQEFYHVITNSDGNEIYELSDQWQSWDTTTVPDGEYVVQVTARDVAGNETTQSMTVTTDNVR